jgi:hypothetical protein
LLEDAGFLIALTRKIKRGPRAPEADRLQESLLEFSSIVARGVAPRGAKITYGRAVFL